MKIQSPTPDEIKTARIHAGLTQSNAAIVVNSTLPSWQQWEYSGEDPSRRRRMHPSFWELFLYKTGQLQLLFHQKFEPENVKPRLVQGTSYAKLNRMLSKVESMPKETAHEKKSYARTRWLLMLLAHSNLSLANIAKLKMSYFATLKARDPLIEELKLYRLAMDLPENIDLKDDSPAVIKFGNESESMSRAGLHLIIKPILDIT